MFICLIYLVIYHMVYLRNKNKLALTANISKLGNSGLLKVCTFNQNCNGLKGRWHRNPSLLILATRYLQPKTTYC